MMFASKIRKYLEIPDKCITWENRESWVEMLYLRK